MVRKAQAGTDRLVPDVVVAGYLPVPVGLAAQVLLSTVVVEELAEACMQEGVSDDCAAAGMQGVVQA